MNFWIRYASLEDMPQVNALRKQVNTLHAEGRPDIFRSDFCQELQQHVYEELMSETSDVIVAVSGEMVCGFVTAQYIARTESPYNKPRCFYRIEEFGVAPEFRRQGIATALIAFCREEAHKRGFPRIELDVWEFNQDAQKFYQAVGFQTYRRYMEMDIPE